MQMPDAHIQNGTHETWGLDWKKSDPTASDILHGMLSSILDEEVSGMVDKDGHICRVSRVSGHFVPGGNRIAKSLSRAALDEGFPEAREKIREIIKNKETYSLTTKSTNNYVSGGFIPAPDFFHPKMICADGNVVIDIITMGKYGERVRISLGFIEPSDPDDRPRMIESLRGAAWFAVMQAAQGEYGIAHKVYQL